MCRASVCASLGSHAHEVAIGTQSGNFADISLWPSLSQCCSRNSGDFVIIILLEVDWLVLVCVRSIGEPCS